jgi:hypothetical protein
MAAQGGFQQANRAACFQADLARRQSGGDESMDAHGIT